MKRFSVLLVVVAFLIPLVVYGLNGNFDRSFADKGLELETPRLSFASSDLPSDESEPPHILPHEEAQLPRRLEVFPAPEGFKGTIKEIDRQNLTFILSDVSFFNPRTNMQETGDFLIHTQLHTTFLHNLSPMTGLAHLTQGMEVVCQGKKTNFDTKAMEETDFVHSGRYHEEGEKTHIPFAGMVSQVDRSNNALIVEGFIFPHHLVQNPYIIKITSNAFCRKLILGETFTSDLPNGSIPENFIDGMFIQGMAEVSYGNDFCSALDITFIFEN
ncbi:MAG TPA: hypothetical protein PK581_03120 [Caldisericia bacterium]|nr:hypothetical protein [Caldisericia bacterium]